MATTFPPSTSVPFTGALIPPVVTKYNKTEELLDRPAIPGRMLLPEEGCLYDLNKPCKWTKTRSKMWLSALRILQSKIMIEAWRLLLSFTGLKVRDINSSLWAY